MERASPHSSRSCEYSDRNVVTPNESVDQMIPLAQSAFNAAVGDDRVVLSLDHADDITSVKRLHSAIDGKPRDGRRYRLDMANLTGNNIHSRVNAKWGALVTNLLMGESFQNASVELQPPTRPAANTQLARSGMLFALARHRDLEMADNSESYARDNFSRWERDWVPTKPQLTLFDLGGDNVAPTSVENKVVAFLNPRSSRIEVNARKNAIYPWLQGFLGAVEHNTTMDVLRDLSVVTTELLDNVRDHAQSKNSFLVISEVNGSHKNRGSLQLVIVDDGRGMQKTINEQHLSDDPNQYLLACLNDKAPVRTGGRGDGLAKIIRRTKKYRGEIFVASGPTSDGTTVLVDHDYARSETVDAINADKDLGVQGTVVVLKLPHAEMSRKSRLL